MNTLISRFLIALSIFSIAIFYSSCKAKKAVAPKEQVVVLTPPEPPKAEEPIKQADTDGDGIPDSKDECPDEKGDTANGCPEKIVQTFNYKNIQFEFNSSVLKTSSYATLDEIARAMKSNPTGKFQLDGHSSAEGTEQRNMMLSVDRANAVKAYLVNNGIAANKLITKGYGESVPLVDNTTEQSRALNRRVEVKPL